MKPNLILTDKKKSIAKYLSTISVLSFITIFSLYLCGIVRINKYFRKKTVYLFVPAYFIIMRSPTISPAKMEIAQTNQRHRKKKELFHIRL